MLPKRIEKALKDRTKYITMARNAGYIIDEYAAEIGLDAMHPDFNDACLVSDIRIFCETGCAESITREALLKVLNEKKEKSMQNSEVIK